MKPQYDSITLIISFFAVVIAAIATYYAFRQSNIAEDTAHRQLRAYLGFNFTTLHYTARDYKIPPSYEYSIFNHGQTPAKMVHIEGKIKILHFPLPVNFIPEYLSSKDIPDSSVVFPGDNAMKGFIKSEDSSLIEEIIQTKDINKNIRCYLFARVTYTDCFEVEHCTSFCMFLAAQSIAFEPDGKTFKKFNREINSRYNNWD